MNVDVDFHNDWIIFIVSKVSLNKLIDVNLFDVVEYLPRSRRGHHGGQSIDVAYYASIEYHVTVLTIPTKKYAMYCITSINTGADTQDSDTIKNNMNKTFFYFIHASAVTP